MDHITLEIPEQTVYMKLPYSEGNIGLIISFLKSLTDEKPEQKAVSGCYGPIDGDQKGITVEKQDVDKSDFKLDHKAKTMVRAPNNTAFVRTVLENKKSFTYDQLKKETDKIQLSDDQLDVILSYLIKKNEIYQWGHNEFKVKELKS